MNNDSSRYLLIALVIAGIAYFVWGKTHPDSVPHRHDDPALPSPTERANALYRLTTPSSPGRAGIDVTVSSRSGAITSVRMRDAQFSFKHPRLVPGSRDADPRTPSPGRSVPPSEAEGLSALWERISPPTPPDNAAELRPDPDRRLEMVSTWNEQALPLRMKLTVRRGDQVVTPNYYDFEGRQVSGNEVELTWRGGDVEVVRSLRGVSPYAVAVRTTVTNRGAAASVEHRVPLYHWVERGEEAGSMFGRRPWQIAEGACQHGSELFREARDEMEKRDDNRLFAGPARMAAVSNLYFAQGLVPTGDTREDARCSVYAWNRPDNDAAVGSLYISELWWRPADLAAGASRSYETTAYFGPKIDTVLAATDPTLVDTINLRFFFWRFEMFNFGVRQMVRFLRFLHGVSGNWGVAIILLTICIRILLLPLLIRSMKSMVVMQKLKPELDEINRKFGDNAEARGLAMMELYRKHGMSPLSQVSGCLPLVAQLPIWAALYSSLQTSVELFHSPFGLWYHDLSAPDPYFMLPLILGGLMFAQQKLMPPQGMDPVQAKMLTYFMPGFMTLISLFLPSGLALYMLVNTLLSIIQQWYTKKQMDGMSGGAGPGAGGIVVKPLVETATLGDAK
jgi:YidC/Oxa1 family membrane protein insertase